MILGLVPIDSALANGLSWRAMGTCSHGPHLSHRCVDANEGYQGDVNHYNRQGLNKSVCMDH